MPFILLAEILLIALCYQWIPLSAQTFFYTVSLSIKSLILFVLPALIFGLLFKSAAQLSSRASKVILGIVAALCLSNIVSTLLGLGIGSFVSHFDLSFTLPEASKALEPAGWVLTLPSWISNGAAMGLGAISGALLGMKAPKVAAKISAFCDKGVRVLLKGLLLSIPLFIGGFILKIQHDKILTIILKQYGVIFAIVMGSLLLYLALAYLILSKWQGKPFRELVKNMLPAAMTGFSSMSSAAAMPLTIIGAQKNSRNPDLAKAVVPTTVNIHLVGDCFAIPIFACAILSSFHVIEPSPMAYLIFAGYFVLAKFSVAAVPGGGILVMLPVLQTYLGFDGAMLSLITALYILLDPAITCMNILGNGAFATAMSCKLPAKDSSSNQMF